MREIKEKYVFAIALFGNLKVLVCDEPPVDEVEEVSSNKDSDII